MVFYNFFYSYSLIRYSLYLYSSGYSSKILSSYYVLCLSSLGSDYYDILSSVNDILCFYYIALSISPFYIFSFIFYFISIYLEAFYVSPFSEYFLYFSLTLYNIFYNSYDLLANATYYYYPYYIYLNVDYCSFINLFPFLLFFFLNVFFYFYFLSIYILFLFYII